MMRSILAGGSGFLGRSLAAVLAADGHEVVVLSRTAAPAPTSWTGTPGVRPVAWSGTTERAPWWALVDGADAVINLAGENIAGARWTPARKALLERSRLDTTGAMVAAILAAAQPPPVLINASAVGIYGSRGDERLTESSSPADDFLAQLVVRWEAAAQRAASTRTRVVCLRTGLALAADGGALERMLLPFRMGLGGPLGSGRQFMAWIHRDDWIALVRWLLAQPVDGPVNATAPDPVTNAEFTRALGAALHRPTILAAPAFALKLALGEMAEPLLFASQRVIPRRALDAGFTFRHPAIGPALEDVVRSR